MNKKRLNLRQLFSNTKFLVVFSIVVAFIFWIVVALEYAPVVENEIDNIPVKIDMENSVPDKLGLQIFGQSEYTINITVKGNRYVVGGDLLTADDFEATAQTAYVDAAGNHSLQVKVTAKDANADYEIISKSADYIEVYFDKYAEKEVTVTPRIISELDDYTDDEYMFDKEDIIYNTKTVKVSGAQTEVNAVKAAYADIEINKALTESVTVDSSVVLSNGSDMETKYVKINGESSLKIPVTLPVYRIRTLPTSVSFTDAPSDYVSKPLSYTCSPSIVRVAVLQNGGSDSKSFEIGSIDFKDIIPSRKTFTFNASDIKNAKMLDGTTTFTVELDMDSLSYSSFTVSSSQISVSGSDKITAKNVDADSLGKVVVVGKTSDLAQINSSMILVSVNLSGVTLTEGENTVPATVTLRNSGKCWVCGTYNITITN